jgi:hypothetical protein
MKTRFIKSALKTAQEAEVVMPWVRGTRRAAFVAKRAAPMAAPRSKSA